jgi:hypothetical protein
VADFYVRRQLVYKPISIQEWHPFRNMQIKQVPNFNSFHCLRHRTRIYGMNENPQTDVTLNTHQRYSFATFGTFGTFSSQPSQTNKKSYIMCDTIDYPNFAMSPPSSFCSDASSCGKSSPHPSSISLRRSTVDLSLLDFSGRPSQSCLQVSSRINSSGSSQMRIASDSFDFPRKSSFHQRQKVNDHVTRHYHRGIESIIEDTFLDPLGAIDIFASICSIVLSLVLDTRKPEHIEVEETTTDANNSRAKLQSQYDDEPDDDPFSPCQVKIANPDANDDWDYFADFQEQVDDDFSFSPFAKKSTKVLDTLIGSPFAKKSKKVLDTLNESEEENASGEA